MIMSLKAASLGLNMVAACHVLMLDLWWNPTTEDQAIDRAHRIGQTRPVTVLRLTVKDTVEDRILALQVSFWVLCKLCNFHCCQGKAFHYSSFTSGDASPSIFSHFSEVFFLRMIRPSLLRSVILVHWHLYNWACVIYLFPNSILMVPDRRKI